MQRAATLKVISRASKVTKLELRCTNSMRFVRSCSYTAPPLRLFKKETRNGMLVMEKKFLSIKANANPEKKSKTAGDVFLDNLGTIFLSCIGMIILALVRSSKATTAKNNLRAWIEEHSSLDPFEIDELRKANADFDEKLFHQILERLDSGEISFDPNDMTYNEFKDHVMQLMRSIKGDQFTIKFGHLMDRVVIAENENKKCSDISFFLVVLTLTVNCPIRDRVELLFQIMKTFGDASTKNATTEDKTHVPETDIIKMIDLLQKSCQLVPDTQIIESETKYPIQQYKVGSPLELMAIGKNAKKDKLSDGALSNGESNERKWTCDDFHHLLRSKGVCAWGECYVKKKLLE